MSESFSFNLVDEPWLPCVRPDGSRTLLSLRDTLTQAHQLQSLSGDSPPETAALHRLLLAILHRIFGPADHDQWATLWDLGRWEQDVVNAYLDQWRHRFDLFDTQYPFYQAEDPRMKPKSTISLSHDRASGNNATLFDHHTEETGESLSLAQAARVLVTSQAYGLAGLSGISQTFTDGPCAGGIVFLVEGDNLWQTLLLNMIGYPTRDNEMPHSAEDRPVWEMDNPFEPERQVPFGYLDYLTWQNRRVLLLPERVDGAICVRNMVMGPALRLSFEVLDTMQHYRPHEKLGHVAISFSENRVLWRDSATLFSFHKDIRDHYRPPATFDWLRELIDWGVLEREQIYRMMACGISKKQAKVFFFREERLPLPFSYLTRTTLVEKLTSALSMADALGFGLITATRRIGMYLQLSDPEEKQWKELNPTAKGEINNWVTHTGAERHYWSTLGLDFQLFIVDLVKDEENAVLRWHQALRDAALAAFERAASYTGTDGRSFKAVVRGRSVLRSQLRRVIPAEQKEVMA